VKAFDETDDPFGPPVVHFENVGVRYGLGPEVLRDVTFSIEPRSFQFLTGPSGAGKTTLLRLISCRCGRRGGSSPCSARR
jgi:cell division transport system ATP-binding protein